MAEAILGAGLTAVGFSTATSLIAFARRSAPFGFGGNANSDLTAAETPRITSPKRTNLRAVTIATTSTSGNTAINWPCQPTARANPHLSNSAAFTNPAMCQADSIMD